MHISQLQFKAIYFIRVNQQTRNFHKTNNMKSIPQSVEKQLRPTSRIYEQRTTSGLQIQMQVAFMNGSRFRLFQVSIETQLYTIWKC